MAPKPESSPRIIVPRTMRRESTPVVASDDFSEGGMGM